MKPNEYPSPQELAEGLKKLTGKEIPATQLTIKEPEWMKASVDISTEVSYLLTYLAANKKTGRIQVTVKPQKWEAKKSIKEFDTDLDMRDVENVTSYTHQSAIQAFKAAVNEILKAK